MDRLAENLLAASSALAQASQNVEDKVKEIENLKNKVCYLESRLSRNTDFMNALAELVKEYSN